MQLNRISTGYSAVWNNGIISFARRLREVHDTLYAEVEVKVRESDRYLMGGQLNLSSTTIRKQHAKLLEEQHPLGDTGNWQDMLNEFCWSVVKSYHQGNPVQLAGNGEEAKPPQWVLEPFIRKGMLNGIIGKRDSGKSLFAIACALTCQILGSPASPRPTSSLNLTVGEPLLFLYLDWETSFEDFDWRYKCVCAGMGVDPELMPYRKCDRPLAREIEGVSQAVEESKVGGIIIDSVGMAAGGDLNKTESPFEFLSALRSLKSFDGSPLTTLVIGHPSKDPETNKPTFSGSGFFSNEVRNNWELQAKPTLNQGEKLLYFYHNKWNTTFYHQPKAWVMTYDEAARKVSFSPSGSPDDPEDKKVPIWMRVKRVLARGPLTIDELRDELGLTASSKEAESLISTLSRSKKLFINVNGHWGLLAQESPGQELTK